MSARALRIDFSIEPSRLASTLSSLLEDRNLNRIVNPAF
jgi:hypothetical protein